MLLKDMHVPADARLICGFEGREDAGVYKLNDNTALILTVDFFTPMVDDPYAFGQIAAANALNDVYAMGGKPLLAMNLVMYPECDAGEELVQILAGGLDKISEAGALLVGGHSVDDQEPKYGLSVTGIVDPERLLLNKGACPGDRLFLTKPLGSGVISTALKAEMAEERHVREAIDWMSTLNSAAAQAAIEHGASAATDVTGFGLVGHLLEMARASDVDVSLELGGLEWMNGALEAAATGLIPGGAYRNQDFYSPHIQLEGRPDPDQEILIYSPETSGGMLVAINEEKAQAFRRQLLEEGVPCFPVGQILGRGFKAIRLEGGAL